MDNQFQPIEFYEYETKEKNSIKVTNFDNTEFLFVEGKDIKKISINTKTGNILLILKIIGADFEKKFLQWKRDPKNLIKTIEVKNVKGGHAKYYKLKVGIQMVHEDYGRYETMIVLKHDTRESPLFQAFKPLDHGVYADIKIDKRDIKFQNVSKDTMINLGLSGVALGLAISATTVSSVITIPVFLTLATSTSAFVSAGFDFTFELTETFEKRKGEFNMLKQLVGEVGKLLAEVAKQNPNTAEKDAEKIYDVMITTLAMYSGYQGIKALMNPKNYKVSFNRKNYIIIKKIRLKGSQSFQGIEGGIRKLNKSKLGSDVINGVGVIQEGENAIK